MTTHPGQARDRHLVSVLTDHSYYAGRQVLVLGPMHNREDLLRKALQDTESLALFNLVLNVDRLNGNTFSGLTIQGDTSKTIAL